MSDEPTKNCPGDSLTIISFCRKTLLLIVCRKWNRFKQPYTLPEKEIAGDRIRRNIFCKNLTNIKVNFCKYVDKLIGKLVK